MTRALLASRAELMDRLWINDARFRQAWRSITIVWGTVLLADSGLRGVMSYSMPVPIVPAADTALTIVMIVVLQLPTHLLLRRSGSWDLLFRPGSGRSATREPDRRVQVGYRDRR
jgi:hypothetical protein